jgi:hypothetical protein
MAKSIIESAEAALESQEDASFDALLPEDPDQPARDTKSDTVKAEGHTEPEKPAEPEYRALLDQLKNVADKIPQQELEFLNRNFQPAFNSKVNMLRDSVQKSVNSVLTDVGVKLPEGKSGYDLLMENDGKDFFNVLRQAVAAEVGPVRQEIAAAKAEKVMGEAITLAVNEDPLVKKHYGEAVNIINSNPNLTKMSWSENGTGIYDVLRGVAHDLELKSVLAERDALVRKIEDSKIATRTARGTTRASNSAARTDATKPKTLQDIARSVAETVFSNTEA